jgi:hypothetical protein
MPAISFFYVLIHAGYFQAEMRFLLAVSEVRYLNQRKCGTNTGYLFIILLCWLTAPKMMSQPKQ